MELFEEFEICFSHLADAESYYKKVKQELVLGFDGVEGDDSKHMYTVLQLQFLITNTLFWKVLIGYLSSLSPAFANWRQNALLTKWRIFQTSLFDVCLTVLPVVGTIALYEHAVTLHLIEFGMIAAMEMHRRMMKGGSKDVKEAGIFTDWILPGGSNPHSTLYTVET